MLMKLLLFISLGATFAGALGPLVSTPSSGDRVQSVKLHMKLAEQRLAYGH